MPHLFNSFAAVSPVRAVQTFDFSCQQCLSEMKVRISALTFICPICKSAYEKENGRFVPRIKSERVGPIPLPLESAGVQDDLRLPEEKERCDALEPMRKRMVPGAEQWAVQSLVTDSTGEVVGEVEPQPLFVLPSPRNRSRKVTSELSPYVDARLLTETVATVGEETVVRTEYNEGDEPFYEQPRARFTARELRTQQRKEDAATKKRAFFARQQQQEEEDMHNHDMYMPDFERELELRRPRMYNCDVNYEGCSARTKADLAFVCFVCRKRMCKECDQLIHLHPEKRMHAKISANVFYSTKWLLCHLQPQTARYQNQPCAKVIQSLTFPEKHVREKLDRNITSKILAVVRSLSNDFGGNYRAEFREICVGLATFQDSGAVEMRAKTKRLETQAVLFQNEDVEKFQELTRFQRVVFDWSKVRILLINSKII